VDIEQRQVTAFSDKTTCIKRKSLHSACRCVMPTRTRGNEATIRCLMSAEAVLAATSTRTPYPHAAKAVHPPSKQTTASTGAALTPLFSTVHTALRKRVADSCWPASGRWLASVPAVSATQRTGG
jgi:hypothetical protein